MVLYKRTLTNPFIEVRLEMEGKYLLLFHFEYDEVHKELVKHEVVKHWNTEHFTNASSNAIEYAVNYFKELSKE